MSTTSRPRTRSQLRQAQLDLEQNNDDSDISADGFEPDTISDELGAIRHAIDVLDAGDRRKLDQFLAAQETFIIQLKGYQINYHFLNKMTVTGIENWATENIKAALGEMNKVTRKQDKIAALLKALKEARADIRYQHNQLMRYYVDIGLDEKVLLGGRRILSNNNNNSDSGSESVDRYDPDEDEDQDDDVNGIDMNVNLNNNDNGNDNSVRVKGTRAKSGRKGKNGKGKNDIRNNVKNDNKNGKGKRKKKQDLNLNNNNNNNENEEISDDIKNDDIDISNIFKDLPPTFQIGLANYIRDAWNGHAAASGLQGAPAPGFVGDQLNGKQGGGSGGGSGSILDKQDAVPPDPKKKQYTKEQLAARKQVAQLLKGAPRARDTTKQPLGEEDEKGQIHLDLEELMSGEDDEEDMSEGQLTSTEEKRVDLAIRQIREKKGCTYDQAVKSLLAADAQVLLGSKINKHKVKKYDISTALGRKKFSIDLFRQVADKCPRQQDFLDLLKFYHGQEYTRDQAIRKCFEYRWPEVLIPLYILRIAHFEILKLEDKYVNDKDKLLKMKLKYYKQLCESFLPRVFWDSLFKSAKEDLRLHILESLYLLVDKTRNVPIKSFDQCYDVDRARLLSGHGEVVQNYVTNYSNKLGKKSSKQLVRIPKYGGGNTNNNSNNNSGGGQIICKFFNSKNGCNRGRACNHKHVCYKCGDGRHGVESCFKVIEALLNNGVLKRYLKGKELKIVALSAVVEHPNDGGGSGVVRPLSAPAKVDTPARKRQRTGFVQCVQGVDGNWYPVSS